MFICICSAVSDRQIEQALDAGLTSVDALSAQTGAGACCGGCRPLLSSMIDERCSKAVLTV